MPVLVLFPHQLFQLTTIGYSFDYSGVVLVEHPLFFKDKKYPLNFHKKKLILHRASMQHYKEYLETYDHKVHYFDYQSVSEPGQTFQELSKINKEFIYFDPVDFELNKRIKKYSKQYNLQPTRLETPYFLNTRKENKDYFSKNKFYQHKFYIHQRKKLEILINPDQTPIGGKWSFDAENRKKLPKKIDLPPIPNFSQENQSLIQEAIQYVDANFPESQGSSENFFYPLTHQQAKQSLQDFLENRIQMFGDYEDAFTPDQDFIFHSILSAPINIGLLTPQEVIDQTLDFHNKNEIPLNCLEGFIRQVISWREFMRATYDLKGSEIRNSNFWKHKHKLNQDLYQATTGIQPIDVTIQKVMKNAYCHHIERLMVLGNFMCLLELDPHEVYKWFMELFIDAYDWVMVTNVYSMSQFADGGLITTKPYISSANYIKKMSNYPKGEWEDTWTALYWNFIHKHKGFFQNNYRLKMMASILDRMDEDKLKTHLELASEYLKKYKNT